MGLRQRGITPRTRSQNRPPAAPNRAVVSPQQPAQAAVWPGVAVSRDPRRGCSGEEGAVSFVADCAADGGLSVVDRGVDDVAVVVFDAKLDGHVAGHELAFEAERLV